ncbi:FAD-binding protein [Sutterella sp.]|uniref:FAD-binding protein n=1 Tax=Sutterella sp. TaxID=1981025 RepID=UPI0026DFA43B|nr:FAD-binding protein [Sutterella sp.]MDO5532908.1 FAD-binding protein [Sutterella sp.]
MTASLSRRKFLSTGVAAGATAAATAAAPAFAAGPKGIYSPGTYSARAAGIGDVIVTMTFSEDRITEAVLNVANETPSIGQAAAETLRKALLSAQGAQIDAVSGATITSKAVSQAAAKCIAQAKGEAPVEVITKTSAASDGDWLGKEPEIAEKDITATIETDILVVGCGSGGMFAVATAAEMGAKVIGIERFSTGTGVRTHHAALNSRYQKATNVKIDKFDFITMATQYATGHLNQDLVKLFCDESGEVVDWYGDRLAERGVELAHEAADEIEGSRYIHYPAGHKADFTGTDDGKGKRLNGSKILHDYAVAKGARFDYNTRMVKLEKKEGRVTGVIATNSEGKYVRYVARKGVIVATGGYGLNYAMMEALQPFNLTISGLNGCLPGAHGDGIRACLWAGARMDETHSTMIFDRAVLRPGQLPGVETLKKGDAALLWSLSYPWLKVNKDGKRFFNESGTYEGILHSDEYQKDHSHYCLFDANWAEQAEIMRMQGCARLFPFVNGVASGWTVERVRGVMEKLIKSGHLAKADTIEELAEKLGLPPEQLKATVERYNTLCNKHDDEDYGKEPVRMLPVVRPPYYGAKTCGWMLCTMDGIKIDTDMRALDGEGRVIPGLFVVGNDSGGYFANTYPNLVTGMAAGRTATFARHAAKFLAKA